MDLIILECLLPSLIYTRISLYQQIFNQKEMGMQIKILFDSGSLNNKLSTGWGISYLINDQIGIYFLKPRNVVNTNNQINPRNV